MSKFDFEPLRTSDSIPDSTKLKQLFSHFTVFELDGLNLTGFTNLLNDLFVDGSGRRHSIPEHYPAEIFAKLNPNNDDVIDFEEFEGLWDSWLRTVLRPKSALVIVDVQNDFISGSMALKNFKAKHDGAEVVPVINSMLTDENCPFDLIVYTFDWHPEDHISFFENLGLRNVVRTSSEDIKVGDEVTFEGPPRTVQRLWPAHCVQNSKGAELDPNLIVSKTTKTINVYKGTNSNVDSYSAFWDNSKGSQTELCEQLRKNQITDVFVCGLALDICVGFTASHAIEHGFRTVLVEDASRGVDEDQIRKLKNKISSMNGVVVDSKDVPNLVLGKDRRVELAYHSAMQL